MASELRKITQRLEELEKKSGVQGQGNGCKCDHEKLSMEIRAEFDAKLMALQELEDKLQSLIDARVTALQTHVDDKFASVEASIGNVHGELEGKLEQVKGEVMGMEGKLSAVFATKQEVAGALESFCSKGELVGLNDKVDGKFSQIDEKLAEFEGKFESM